MKVRAISTGYYGNKRIRKGEVFELPIKDLKKDKKTGEIVQKDGKPVLPKWVEPADKPAESKVEKREPAKGGGAQVI